MDLSFTRFDKDMAVTGLPPELAVLLVSITARQAASPTAVMQARSARVALAETVFAPLDGAFNGPVAALLMKWKDE